MKLTDVKPGMKVTYFRTVRCGTTYVIPATVIRLGNKLVLIETELHERIWVADFNIQPREF